MSRDEVEAFVAGGAGVFPPCERVIETSIARVFLFPDRVLKLKKPVHFGFLDFTTLEQRRWAIERELAFNRATAPDLYREVHAVVRREDGGLALDGTGEPLEWLLEMRRFPDGAVLADQPERVDGAMGEALGREIARFHAVAPTVAGASAKDCLAYVLASNASLLRPQAARLGGAERLEQLLANTDTAFQAVAPLLAGRAGEGFVRRCHGDLHLGNIFVERGRPVLFDCIEFNDTLSQIDVLYDLAFLLMDLEFRGASAAANRTFNGWLDQAARALGEPGLYQGLAALPLFQAVRATIRVHVSLHQGEDALAGRYLAAAEAHLARAEPRLVAVGGRSGSGKSTYARRIAPTLRGAPGAVVLRSDEIRKRLWGREPLEPLPPQAYAREESQRVYAALIDAGRACLAAGRAVILDAAFLQPAERAAAEALAREAGVAFEGVWLEAPAEVLRARIADRTGDASDADVAVLERQLGFDLGEIGWRREQGGAATGSE